MQTLINRLVLLLIVTVLCGTILNVINYWSKGRFIWEKPEPPKSTEQKVAEEEAKLRASRVKFLSAIIRHSFRSDDKERLLVALAAKNTKQLLGKDYEWIFRNAGEMVPPWSKKGAYYRWEWVVRSLGSKGDNAAADSLAEQVIADKFQEPYASILEKLEPTERCVTTYYRPEGNEDPQTPADLADMRAWKPKVYEAHDKAFWLCLPPKRPAKIPGE